MFNKSKNWAYDTQRYHPSLRKQRVKTVDCVERQKTHKKVRMIWLFNFLDFEGFLSSK